MLFVALFSVYQAAQAGAYIFAGEENGVDVITHPQNYTGDEDVVTVRVCIDPASPDAANMEYSMQNNIDTYNNLNYTHGNIQSGNNNNIPSGALDFESVSLHEIGHCLGMAHVNLASESGLSGLNRNYTKTTDGSDNVFNIDDGADNKIGSSDDLRGDDVNLHWFRVSNNDPFTIDTVVDSTTYSRDLSDLPAGHTFATNADRAVSLHLGYTRSEAVMQQGTFYDEAQRELGHDDVATLRYAMSGVDERESGGPRDRNSRDNYSLVLEYGGISDVDCDVSMSMTTTNSLAFCSVGGEYVDYPDHLRISTATIEYGSGYNWFFNEPNSAPVLEAIGDQVVIDGDNLVVDIVAGDVDANTLSLQATGLPPFVNFSDNGDGTASLIISPNQGFASSHTITVTVSDNGEPVNSDDETFDIIVSLDADDDGLSDYHEVNTHGTSPTDADSDDDYINDYDEVNFGSDPNDDASWPNFADGDIAPLGSPDGVVNAADYLVMQRITLGELTATSLELAHGDLYPPGSPDGVINTSDLIRLLKLVQP